MQLLHRFENLGNLEHGLCAGDATLEVFAGQARLPRQAVLVTNNDDTLDLWIGLGQSPTPPTLDASSFARKLSPGQSVEIGAGPSVRIWLRNASASPTQSPYSALELC